MQRSLVLISCLMLGAPALAQEVSTLPVQQFLPSSGGWGDYTHVMGAETGEPMQTTVGLFFNYASLPLVYQLEGDSYIPMLLHQPQLELMAERGLGRRFSFGLAMPLVVGQEGGESDYLGLPSIPSTALGDLRLVPKARLLRTSSGFNLALALPVGLPTGDEQAYAGEAGVTFRPTVVLERSGEGPLQLGLNVGTFGRKKVEQNGLTVGTEVTYGLGVGYTLQPDRLRLMAEVFGRASFADDEGVSVSTLPLELMLSARYAPAPGHALTLGGGPGLIRGYGTPKGRLLLGYSMAFGGDREGSRPGDRDRDGVNDDIDECPKAKEDVDLFLDDDGCPDPDNDRDGILDTVDRCVEVAEDKDGFQDEDGCPDLDNDSDRILDANDTCPNEKELENGFEDEDGCPEKDADGDGILDAIDRCPNEPEFVNSFKDDDGCPEPDQDGDGVIDGLDKCPRMPESMNGFKDGDGCPEPDVDKDGKVDALDKCPKIPELVNGFKDDDGCPEPDTDKDTLVDGQDECPKMPETRNGYQDADGCPDVEPKIEVTEKSITLSERVFFDTGTAKLKPRSQDLLERVTKVLMAHPEVTKIRIEGHTDNVGEPKMNLELSQRRAEAVRDFLIEKGVAADRLEAVGYGETRPMVPNKTETGREKNRRVVLWILEMNGQPVVQ